MRVEQLGIRWTIGAVSERGFAALALSVWGAWRIFGPAARYAISVNSLPLDTAKRQAGALPEAVTWLGAEGGALPEFLRGHLDDGLAQGVAWKFAPLRLFPDCYELALDNDCILWRMPEAIRRWLAGESACVLAEDVVPAFGEFAALCGSAPRNTGIRGVPPGFDLAAALVAVLASHPVRLASELDEQGLQVAALSQGRAPLVVTADEVTICSPFPPHVPHLGRCGVHFVGLNMKEPRPGYDREALARIAANWDGYRAEIAASVGAPEASGFSKTHWSSGMARAAPAVST